MAFNKKQQIRGFRILLTVFYGFLLSSTVFRYLIHGIVETIRQPRNPYAIGMIIIGAVILVSMILATYATWYDNRVILLVSAVVLICVFILTLVFGILRIVKNAPKSVATNSDENSNVTVASDFYAVVEAVVQLAIELIAILFAILATFVLIRYIKDKYQAVSTQAK